MDQPSKTNQKLIKIAGLWKNESGTAIKSMKFDKDVQIVAGMKLIVLPNKKQHDRQPDYQAFLAPVEGQPVQQTTGPSFSDDIPF